ncbi:MAG: hypothetical protein HOV87_24415 [Catenulispora sp.]|nr:hypothetical protein [Catenulispora sp.]
MSIPWESTTLLWVADKAYVRTEYPAQGRELRELVECPHCHRITDWLIAARGGRVEIVCRCGRCWRLTAQLSQLVALAEGPPTDPSWTCLDDARAALGFDRRPASRRQRHDQRRSSTMSAAR